MAAEWEVIEVDAAAGLRLVRSVPYRGCDVQVRLAIGKWISAMHWPDGAGGATQVEVLRVALGWAANVAARNLDEVKA